MSQTKLNKSILNKIDMYIDAIEEKQSALIPALHYAQEVVGYLPVELQMHIASKLNVPSAKVNGVVTFYSYFTEKPRGKHVINVCLGTACYVRGADAVLKELEKELGISSGQTTEDFEFTVDSLRCVGACGLAPVVIVDGKVHGRVEISDVAAILAEVKK